MLETSRPLHLARVCRATTLTKLRSFSLSQQQLHPSCFPPPGTISESFMCPLLRFSLPQSLTAGTVYWQKKRPSYAFPFPTLRFNSLSRASFVLEGGAGYFPFALETGSTVLRIAIASYCTGSCGGAPSFFLCLTLVKSSSSSLLPPWRKSLKNLERARGLLWIGAVCGSVCLVERGVNGDDFLSVVLNRVVCVCVCVCVCV